MIATADTTIAEAARLVAALPIPTEKDRKVERLRSIALMPAQDRKGFLWRSGERMEGSASIFRNEDDGLDVMISSDLGDDPLAAGSLAGRLADLGLTTPASWRPATDMACLCGFAAPAGEAPERVVEIVLAALRLIGGGVPVNGYEIQRHETFRRSQYWVDN